MNYAKLAFTDSIRQLQTENGSRKSYERVEQFGSYDGLTANETRFIELRDSFYVASVGENDFPYIQHRGGPQGFLKVVDDKTLGFLDFAGNRQFITLGNVKHSDKVALILMDYPNRARMKLYARAEVVELGERPELESWLWTDGYKAKPERIILYHVEAFDWNCPQHITPRYTEQDIKEALEDQTHYIKTLEDEVKQLRELVEGAR
ncbi:pyridoxamine 5'-phosphate oxidase family protein [Roseivirga sp.]|uniref:pyridoxamine 5'-phosphate oxidase family protein n=1 Tax=Roseivirga sp. TaxID=1964215 RepID=UPI003B522C37